MSIRYRQNPPALFIDGQTLHFPGQALYSGYGSHKNKPEDECLAGLGPIPRGVWRIVRWDDHHGSKGPTVAVLAPVGHDAHGRSGFLIHGDSGSHPGAASSGCIVAGPSYRARLRASGETQLEVFQPSSGEAVA
jgi:hypothetical protein